MAFWHLPSGLYTWLCLALLAGHPPAICQLGCFPAAAQPLIGTVAMSPLRSDPACSQVLAASFAPCFARCLPAWRAAIQTRLALPPDHLTTCHHTPHPTPHLQLVLGIERSLIAAECEVSHLYNAEEQARLARIREEGIWQK